MKSKGILIAKIVFLALIVAGFFIIEDPIVRKCRKAELIIANMEASNFNVETIKMCSEKLEKAKTLIQIAQVLDCQMKAKKKMGEGDYESVAELSDQVDSLRSEAELLLDEIIISTISPEQLALLK